jgi:hypothetical protein
MSTQGAVAATAPVADPGADARWTEWVADGVTSDRAMQRRTVWFQAVTGCALVGWLLYALLVR